MRSHLVSLLFWEICYLLLVYITVLLTLAGLPGVDMDIQFGFHNTMKFMMPCHLVVGQNLSWIRDPLRRMEVLEERELTEDAMNEVETQYQKMGSGIQLVEEWAGALEQKMRKTKREFDEHPKKTERTQRDESGPSEFLRILPRARRHCIRTCSRRRRVCRSLLPIPVCLGPPFPKKISQDWVLPLFFLLGWQENRGEPFSEFGKITWRTFQMNQEREKACPSRKSPQPLKDDGWTTILSFWGGLSWRALMGFVFLNVVIRESFLG